MNTEALFKQLDPPAGGAERFARRLEAVAGKSAGKPLWPLAVAGAACAAAAVVVAVLVLRAPTDDVAPVAAADPVPVVYDSPAFDRLLGRPLKTEQLTATVNKQTAAVTELESRNDKVRIYELN
jgi:hypothetical protein